MATLKEKLAQAIPSMREEIRRLIAEHGDDVISEVTVAQAYGGMRDIQCLVCDTSNVLPDKGLLIRGRPILELADRLPEEVFFLLCTGELPDADSLKSLRADLRAHAEVPPFVWRVLRDLPSDTHPMEMFDTAILVLERDSVFRQRYSAGMRKELHWEPALEDSLRLLAKLPALAAGVYRIRFNQGELIQPDPEQDWAGNYARMIGIPDQQGQLADLLRLYLTLHCDHESGNVSAFTCHVVASSLADPYFAVSAGLGGLAGPLHGLASQECVEFVLEVLSRFKGVPTSEQLRSHCWKLLESGRVIPGYGHAVLRVTDPRFAALHAFGRRVCPNAPAFQVVDLAQQVVPGVLRDHGKSKDPFPNVDAASGSLLYSLGLTERSYYTVVFGVSRALGMLAQLILNRAIGAPIVRPKSVTTDWIKEKCLAAARQEEGYP
jgi:citrate synthase